MFTDGIYTYELKYPALLGIQDKVKEFEWLITFIWSLSTIETSLFQLLR
jgi:hypothetical protein